MYCKAVEEKTDGLVDYVSLFIDGTKAAICRPGAQSNENMQDILERIHPGDQLNLQKAVYSGHKRKHCLNYQGVIAPDGKVALSKDYWFSNILLVGICVSCFGPIEGRRHDSTMLRESKLLSFIREHPILSHLGVIIYGDPAYGINDLLCSPFKGAQLSEEQKTFNATLSRVRVSVEWFFGILKRTFAFMDWNQKHKILLSPVAKFMKVSVLLANCHTCLNGGNQISDFFNCQPPTLEEYLSMPNEE